MSWSRGITGIWAACAAALWCAAASAAGDGPGNGEPVAVAQLGWGGVVVADRWGPVAVEVTVGDKPLAGTLLIEFPQDDSQTAQISVPFAATPNRTTRIEAAAAFPLGCERVVFTLADERGRSLQRLEYTRGQSDRTLQLPLMHDSGIGLLACVGRTGLSDVVKVWSSGTAPSSSQRLGQARPRLSRGDAGYVWSRTAAALVQVDELATSWISYDGVLALVVNPGSLTPAGTAPDPRALEAIHQWVRSGGRLVLVVDAAGEAWRPWLPPEARNLVDLGPVERGALPEEVRSDIADAAKASALSRLTEDGQSQSEAPTVPGAAVDVPRRAVSLAPGSKGWKTRWALPNGSALLAQGPIGYGWAAVLGLDPGRAPETVSARASSTIWKDALGPILDDWVVRTAQVLNQGYSNGLPEDRALALAGERLADVPIVGDSVFTAIAASMLGLVALVGPVDFLVLRRLRRGHRSWMTAMGWIALASLGAFAAPRILRTAPTQVNRICVVDATLGGGPVFQSGVTGVYSGRSGTMRVLGAQPTSWWRGRTEQAVGDDFRGLGLVPTAQRAAGGEAGSTRGSPLEEVPFALWTFRSFADDAAASPAWSGVRCRVNREETGYRVEISGMPTGGTVTDAAMRLGGKWYSLSAAPPESAPPARPVYPPRGTPMRRPEPAPALPIGTRDGDSWSGLFALEFAGDTPRRAWSNPQPEGAQMWPFAWSNRATLDSRPGPMLDLPGPDRRALAVEQRTAEGDYAAVYLNIAGLPAEITLAWDAKTDQTAVLRLLVPLSEGKP